MVMVYYLKMTKLFYLLLLFAAGCTVLSSDVLWAETASAADRKTDEYVIGVEDVLNIFVWKEEDLNRRVVVRPDGKISFPLVSDITAAGLSCKELAEKIREKLLYYLKEPNVTVIVEEINSFKVFVLGEVNRQGVFMLKSPARLLQVLAMAEGLSEYAKKSDIAIIRREENKEKVIKVDYRKIISGEKPDDNIYVKPDDTIIVN